MFHSMRGIEVEPPCSRCVQIHAGVNFRSDANDSPQELNETVGGKLEEYIHAINGCYPPEIVEYYSPNYSKILLDKIDEFQPMVA